MAKLIFLDAIVKQPMKLFNIYSSLGMVVFSDSSLAALFIMVFQRTTLKPVVSMFFYSFVFDSARYSCMKMSWFPGIKNMVSQSCTFDCIMIVWSRLNGSYRNIADGRGGYGCSASVFWGGRE